MQCLVWLRLKLCFMIVTNIVKTRECFCRRICFVLVVVQSEDHGEIPWLLVTIGRPQVCRRAKRLGCDLQSARRGLGTDPCLHGLLRGFPGPVRWHAGRSRRLWLQGLDLQRPRGENEKVVSRVGERQAGNDGHHRNVLPGGMRVD